MTSKVNFLFAILFFKLCLDLVYYNFVAVVFEYDNYLLSVNNSNYFISWVLAACVAISLNDKIIRLHHFVAIFWSLIAIFPIFTMYGLDSSKNLSVPLIHFFSLIIFIIIQKINFMKLKQFHIEKSTYYLTIFVCFLFVIYLAINYLYSGVSLNLNFSKVYEFREENSNLSAVGLFSYFNIWTYKVFSIVLLSISLLYSRYYYSIIIFCFQIFFFSASAHKSVLLTAFLVVGIWFIFRRYNKTIFFPLILIFLMFISYIIFIIFNDVVIPSIFLRRLYFLPAQLSYAYFDFFSNNPFVVWSNSFLSSFLSYPYSESISYTIGVFIGKEGSGANNGFISSGYAHGGILGVLFYVIIFSFIVKLIDYLVLPVYPIWFTLAVCIVPISSAVLSSDLFTSILTHGIGILIVVLFFIRKKNK